MNYTDKLRIEVPASLYDVACAIARALDPDTGGYASYGPREQGDPPAVPETYSTETPCTSEFKAQALAMLGNPAMLHYAVEQDYAARWPDLTPPTLAECEAFVQGALVVEPVMVGSGGEV